MQRYGRYAGSSRKVGKDAIRVQVIYRDEKGETLVSQPKRVHRVEGWRENLQKRMNEIYCKVIQVFNKYDRKMKNGDSLRKWVNRKEEEIIEKMNIFHKHPIYHKKSLRMLFQVYFDQIMYSDNN